MKTIKLNIKAFLGALILSAVAGSAFAQTQVLQENFSKNASNVSGSKQVALASGVWDFYYVNASYNTAKQCAVLNYSSANMGYIITPAINKPGVITFDARIQNSTTVSNRIEIQKSVNGGAFTTVSTVLVSGATYQPYSIAVNETADNVRIKFLRGKITPSESTNYNIIIDNVAVSGNEATPGKPELVKVSACVDAGLPGLIEVQIINYDAAATYSWNIDPLYGTIDPTPTNGGVFRINTTGKEGNFTVSCATGGGETSNVLPCEVAKDPFTVTETSVLNLPGLQISSFAVLDPGYQDFEWIANGQPMPVVAGVPFVTDNMVISALPQRDSVIYVTATNSATGCKTRKYREMSSGGTPQFRAARAESTATPATTTYKGSFYEITGENENLLGEDVLVILTNNGGSYSIGLGYFDNVQIDANGNLSREGYVTVEGVNYFLLSGYVTDDELVYRYGMALVSVNPEWILFTFEFRGRKDDATSLTQTSASRFTVSAQARQITVSGTDEPVQVYSIGGQCVAQGAGAGVYAVAQAGVYIVRVGNSAQKIIVQ